MDEEELEDKRLLAENIKTRQTITKLLFDGTKLPTGEGEVKLLLDNLSGIEKIALGRTKNRVKAEGTTAVANAQALIAQAINNRNKLLSRPASINRDTSLPDSVARPDVVPGETEMNPDPINPADILEM